MTSWLTEKTGRIICWILVIVDSLLGTLATFFPQTACTLMQPHVTTADCPADLIRRTGVVWLMYLILQLCAARSRHPARWFFSVGLIRLVEVPADLVYGVLAQDLAGVARWLILLAPVCNGAFGILLVAIAHLIRTPGPPSTREET